MKPNTLFPDYAKLALPVKNPGGHILVDGKHVADTMRCVHCGAQWIYIKGSGRLRGYCKLHNGVTCGRWECGFCIDAERRLEAIENGETLHEVLIAQDAHPVIFLPGDQEGKTSDNTLKRVESEPIITTK